MKNTKQFYFQNGLSVVLQGLNAMLGEGEEYKPSPDMHKNEADGLWYYGTTSNYLIFNDSNMNIILAYYDDLQWTYRSQYDRDLSLTNGKAFKFNSVDECIECLQTGNYDKSTPAIEPLSWNYWYRGPVMYRVYSSWLEPYRREDSDPSQPYYAYYSTKAFDYENGINYRAYVDRKTV